VSPRDALTNELIDLQGEPYTDLASPSEVMSELDDFLPESRPQGVSFSAESSEFDLGEGQIRFTLTPIHGLATTPFAFCFVATNLATEEVSTSEVGLLWQDESGGIASFGFEG
jgi:hypothetical protein